jgi:hypothetical protein
MAHSYVQAHSDEVQAFESFVRSQPDNATLLIDTYDTETAARKVALLAPRLRKLGIAIKAVRLDSGDLGAHARKVRAILDEAGQQKIGIFASGNLDEFRVRELVASGAPIGGFGVGTRMNTSADALYLDCTYKLTEYAGTPRRKRSEGKATWPGRKQVYRSYDAAGFMRGDALTIEDDACDGEPLLVPPAPVALAHPGGKPCACQSPVESAAGIPAHLGARAGLPGGRARSTQGAGPHGGHALRQHGIFHSSGRLKHRTRNYCRYASVPGTGPHSAGRAPDALTDS